jgi:hypothetical protein
VDCVRRAKRHPLHRAVQQQPERVRPFAQALNIDFVSRGRKPWAVAFACAHPHGASKKETVVIGDQIFTDVLGARSPGSTAFSSIPSSRKRAGSSASSDGLSARFCWVTSAEKSAVQKREERLEQQP